MKSTAPGRAAPTPFALHAIAAALAGIGLMSSVSAFAQESSAGADAAAASVQNTVLVSGQRQAAQSAQAIKQNAEQVVDSIVAEDIGKFPDKNVAELLGRITGVQTVRENGEAGRIVIRGLGGVTTLINGREMFTAASRSLNLTDVPVSMLQRVDVYKSQGPTWSKAAPRA
jgi:iron complex outermembrane receptor protein